MTSLSFRDLHTPHTLLKETRNEIIKFDNCPKYSLTHELEIWVFSANGEKGEWQTVVDYTLRKEPSRQQKIKLFHMMDEKKRNEK